MVAIFKFFVVLAFGCALSAISASAEPFTLSSSDFADGDVLPAKYGGNLAANPNCLGENLAPALAWTTPPADAKSLAFYMHDPQGRSGLGSTHWVAYGVAPGPGSFEQGEIARSSKRWVAGKGTRGLDHYLGPCPPPGSGYHHYTFVAIATDLAADALPPGLTLEELLAKLDGHAKGASAIVARFKNPN